MMFWIFAVILVLGIVALVIAGRSHHDRERRRGFRVGHEGRDSMVYEEWIDGEWRRLELDSEMLSGRAHHVIYFESADAWTRHPAWARARRDEIIARIKKLCPPPGYEHDERD